MADGGNQRLETDRTTHLALRCSRPAISDKRAGYRCALSSANSHNSGFLCRKANGVAICGVDTVGQTFTHGRINCTGRDQGTDLIITIITTGVSPHTYQKQAQYPHHHRRQPSHLFSHSLIIAIINCVSPHTSHIQSHHHYHHHRRESSHLSHNLTIAIITTGSCEVKVKASSGKLQGVRNEGRDAKTSADVLTSAWLS
ncbi:hypothetical protein Bbelb_128520 [Branchiostoma belcheri]|nr:hypothetical protein Bbelb_128520 [Branchiostoma belcheri]